MNIKIFIGIWVLIGVAGIAYIINNGSSFSSVTCLTGEMARTESLCPECSEDLHCKDRGPDFVCNIGEQKCVRKNCFSSAECSDDNVCEFNHCIPEAELYDTVA